jgi:hypothetical protein
MNELEKEVETYLAEGWTHEDIESLLADIFED